MKKYKVIHIGGMRLTRASDDFHKAYATALQEEFGLQMFSLDQIIETWEEYSEQMCAGWLAPDKEGIEHAFGVVLEEE